MSDVKTLREASEQGWAIARRVVDSHSVPRPKAEVLEACKTVRDLQIKNAVGKAARATKQLLTLGKSFGEFLECEYLRQIIPALLDGRFGLRLVGGMHSVRVTSPYMVAVTETFLCAE